jgi:hypothetical protein
MRAWFHVWCRLNSQETDTSCLTIICQALHSLQVSRVHIRLHTFAHTCTDTRDCYLVSFLLSSEHLQSLACHSSSSHHIFSPAPRPQRLTSSRQKLWAPVCSCMRQKYMLASRNPRLLCGPVHTQSTHVHMLRLHPLAVQRSHNMQISLNLYFLHLGNFVGQALHFRAQSRALCPPRGKQQSAYAHMLAETCAFGLCQQRAGHQRRADYRFATQFSQDFGILEHRFESVSMYLVLHECIGVVLKVLRQAGGSVTHNHAVISVPICVIGLHFCSSHMCMFRFHVGFVWLLLLLAHSRIHTP